jgi:hypothetical protein
MGKLTPRSLLAQHLDQQVDRMRRSQQDQQMHPPQLRGAEMTLASSGAGVRPLLAEKLVWDKR